MSGKQWILILGGFIVVALFMAFGVSWSGLLIIALIVCMPISGLWGIPGYQCLKCGRETTIQYNTRNYPSSKSIVNVPEEQIEKFYYNYWPDEGDLEEHLKPPEPQTDNQNQSPK